MDHQVETKDQVRAVPVPGRAKGLKKALADLKPMLEKAKDMLKRLPLRDMIDPFTGISQPCRIATSEDLQRILMLTCGGRVIVNTVPVSIGNNPSVSAQICILTDEGYVSLPGSTATEATGSSITDKAVLSAESRSIRRAIRELGLRAEYEDYDPEDSRQQSEIGKQERNKAIPKETPKAAPVVKSKVALDSPDIYEAIDDEDSNIPEGPASFAVKDTKNTVATVVKAKKAPVRRKTTASSTKGKLSTAPKLDIIIPDEEMDIKVDFKHENWPNNRAVTYVSILLDKLGEARKISGLKMDDFIKQVIGKKGRPDNMKLRSCANVELEALYQFYIIQDGKVEGNV
jgi:hypothetical protein